MRIDEIILKVTSRCNLNCRYCYVFNKGNCSYKKEPDYISLEAVKKLFNRIEEYAVSNNQSEIVIIIHGGEPLLLPPDFYSDIVRLSKTIIKSVDVRFAMQSNGTLMSVEVARHLAANNISVGFSLDSTEAGCVDRIYKNGKEAYNNIIRGIKNYHSITGNASILSVINPSIDPKEAYQNFVKLKINYVGFLLLDENYDSISITDSSISNWLIELFDLWFNDSSQNKPQYILPFTTIILKILGQEKVGNEMFGQNKNAVIVIKTNGDIDVVDSLQLCIEERKKINIFNNRLEEIFTDHYYKLYYDAHFELPDDCSKCVVKEICGGGQLAHRYSKENKFMNKSIYCSDIKKLILHIHKTIYDLLPVEIKKETNINELYETELF